MSAHSVDLHWTIGSAIRAKDQICYMKDFVEVIVKSHSDLEAIVLNHTNQIEFKKG